MHGNRPRERVKLLRWKQTRRMAILPDAKDDEVEWGVRRDQCAVTHRCHLGTEFDRDLENLRGRHRHVVEQTFARHASIAFGVGDRHAAFVAEKNLPTRPLGMRATQQRVYRLRRTTAGQHDTEPSIARNPLRGQVRDVPGSTGVQRIKVSKGLPVQRHRTNR